MHIISNCFRITVWLPVTACWLLVAAYCRCTTHISSQSKFHHPRSSLVFLVPHRLFKRARNSSFRFWLLFSPLFTIQTTTHAHTLHSLALKFSLNKQNKMLLFTRLPTRCSASGLSHTHTQSLNSFCKQFPVCIFSAGCSLSLISCMAFNYIDTNRQIIHSFTCFGFMKLHMDWMLVGEIRPNSQLP